MLSNLRRRIDESQKQFDDVLQSEHRERLAVDAENEQCWKRIFAHWDVGYAHVRYREELREKVKVQSALTEKVHALFAVSMEEERAQKAQRREQRLALRRAAAQRIRHNRPANRSAAIGAAQPLVQTIGEAAMMSREERFLSAEDLTTKKKYEETQAKRSEEYHRRYAADIAKKMHVAMRAASVREEEMFLRRGRIVQRALGLHERRKHVRSVREAQSVTPTAFLQLPPLREVFADDVLTFDAPTLMSRHYFSTYKHNNSDDGHRSREDDEGGGRQGAATSMAAIGHAGGSLRCTRGVCNRDIATGTEQ